jgi:small-conductance mechanosensitive channel
MDIQQAINLQIYNAFEQHGIEFAFPTYTVALQNPLPVRLTESTNGKTNDVREASRRNT